MQQVQWVKVLRSARERPAMFIGPDKIAHLIEVTEVFRLMWETQAFVAPRAATLLCSPAQYVIRCETGPLISPIEELTDWQNCDVLFGELLRAGRRLSDRARDDTVEWLEAFQPNERMFGSFGAPLYLADRGLLGIRIQTGLWYQVYEHGWPTAPPLLLQSPSPVGLVIAAALSPEWFTGLPFVTEQVEAAIPQVAKPHVRLEYRPTDDLVPEHLLRPEDIYEWL